MLFYITLLITSLIVITVLLWFLRMVSALTQSIRGTHTPNAKQGPTAHLNERQYNKSSKRASRAWGKKPHATPANLARTHPAKVDKSTPWGWRGNVNAIREQKLKVAASEEATLNSTQARKNLRRETVDSWKQMQKQRQLRRKNNSSLSGQAYAPSQDARSTFAINEK